LNTETKSVKIGIIGAGGWGTALASILVINNHNITLWAYEPHVADEINKFHTNSIFLKGVSISEKVKATTKLENLAESEVLVIATPTPFIRSTLIPLKEFINSNTKIVNGAKGIENKSLMRVSEIIFDTLKTTPDNYTILTGPSHAEEVARKMPTTVVAASDNYALAKEIQNIMSTPNFRVYTTDDVIGCEIGGALKNVIAIAAGIIDGLGLGDNTKAALITRGLAEISRLGVALGANPQTFSGLSGLGDLFVTCNSKHSRNRFVGEQIGLGKTLENITNEMEMVAEGIFTAQSAYFLGKKHNVEMPITEQVYNILFEKKEPLHAISHLMTRQSKREWWW
jgi:glycerol-3-phosphate dehydrogenase (NAD(P)+)